MTLAKSEMTRKLRIGDIAREYGAVLGTCHDAVVAGACAGVDGDKGGRIMVLGGEIVIVNKAIDLLIKVYAKFQGKKATQKVEEELRSAVHEILGISPNLNKVRTALGRAEKAGVVNSDTELLKAAIPKFVASARKPAPKKAAAAKTVTTPKKVATTKKVTDPKKAAATKKVTTPKKAIRKGLTGS